jgi:hypothetical protein
MAGTEICIAANKYNLNEANTSNDLSNHEMYALYYHCL